MPDTATTRPALPACTCGRLRRASRALTQLYDDLMSPSGLRVTQFSLLRTLQRTGTSTLSDLAEACLLDRTATSRNLDPLLDRGLVAIVPGRDARTRQASLTHAGERALRSATPHWKRAQEQVAARIGAGKLQSLVATLDQLETLHPDRATAVQAPSARRSRNG
jgi:DNA-binding MarR family transcriptional regulator